jgi:hypothetical protein
MVWKIWKKRKFNSEKIEKIWKKDKLNRAKIWKLWKKGKMNSEKEMENTEENCEKI